MRVETLPAFEDNYIFVLIDDVLKEAFVVDPGQSSLVEGFLLRHQLNLKAILNTHHHADHTGGNRALCALFPEVEVFASEYDLGRIPCQNRIVGTGDKIFLGEEECSVYLTPGHTLGHVCYHWMLKNGESHAFTGDTLFAGGCGKLFEGTPAQMFSSLSFLRRTLPEKTMVWCAHEYTVENYTVLSRLQPSCKAVQERLAWSLAERGKGASTVPFLFQDELAANSFLRWDDFELKKVTQTVSDLETFTAVRAYRDREW